MIIFRRWCFCRCSRFFNRTYHIPGTRYTLSFSLVFVVFLPFAGFSFVIWIGAMNGYTLAPKKEYATSHAIGQKHIVPILRHVVGIIPLLMIVAGDAGHLEVGEGRGDV